ncbi:TonB-dependent receptor domain-containing protein [Parasphingorhabdus sp. DH2-15]|uniref:TonB-dependent receptor domain-containing protein n=1 Tax=Parasphingorhabdus sp. DH2-15 TaxID=3444112 RepID=UPI003F688321
MRKSNLTRALKSSVAPAIMGLALVASPAMAQDADADELAENTEDAIVVTGTRVNNPNLEQTSPVGVVTADQIDLRQANTVEEFIREIPGVVPSIGGQVNNGNGGSTFINLRGIGANRNITLLNGTRIVPAGLGGITNVDVIPVALLERVDVLTGGAGATYGADAIGGVVNFITKQDFSGLDFTVTQGLTEEGDASTFRADLTLGANFDDGRGNAVLSVGYTDRDAVTQGARPFGAVNIDSEDASEGGSATSIPTGVFFGGLFGQVDPDFNGISAGIASPFNFNPFNLFQLPLEQFRIYGSANYEVTDGITAYTEALYTQSTTATQIAPSGSFFNAVTLPLNNPFLSDGLRNAFCGLANIGQAACDAAGATPFGPTLADGSANPDFLTISPQLGRRFVELGTRDNVSQTDLFQIKAGLRGGITDSIDFDVFASYGESQIISTQSGNGTLTRLNQSLNSVSADACLDPSNGCVPINLFGPIGSITPEVGAFLDVGNSSSVQTSLASIIGFVSGDFGVSIPSAAEPISFVVGGEFREYTAFTASDLLSQTPGEVLGNGAANPNQGGSYDVYEAFGELQVPLLSDVAFAEEVVLDLAARVSRYSTTGTEFTWKAGGAWTVVDGFTIRGNYQQVTRAPNIGELFAPVQIGLGNNSSDPCQGGNPLTDPALAAICDSQVAAGGGFPGFTTAGVSVPADIAGQVNITFGGNPNLAAEDADTWTVGVIVQPAVVPGLSITVDYYNIEITGAISAPSEDDIIASCFGPGAGAAGAPNIPGSALGSAACALIARNPDTGAVAGPVVNTPGFITATSNLGVIATDGIDAVITYNTDLDFANLNLQVTGNWTNSSTFQANPGAINRECVGFFSTNCNLTGSIQPEFSFSSRATLQFESIDLSLLWRYIDAVQLEPLVDATGTFLGSPSVDAMGNPDGGIVTAADPNSPFSDFTRIGAEHYFDLTMRAQVTDNFTITAAIINLLDNDPTVVGSDIGTTAFNSGNIFPSTYDPLGRRFSITGRVTF